MLHLYLLLEQSVHKHVQFIAQSTLVHEKKRSLKSVVKPTMRRVLTQAHEYSDWLTSTYL